MVKYSSATPHVQPQDEQYVYASLEEPASLTLLVEAFPRPLRREVVWREELGGYYRMEVSFPSPSSVRVDITVTHVKEHEYGIRSEQLVLILQVYWEPVTPCM